MVSVMVAVLLCPLVRQLSTQRCFWWPSCHTHLRRMARHLPLPNRLSMSRLEQYAPM